MSWLELLDPEFTERLCLTLLHSLWQVAALTAVASLIDHLWLSKSAAHSYGAYTSALVLSVVAIPATWFLVGVADASNSSSADALTVDVERDVPVVVVEAKVEVPSESKASTPAEPAIASSVQPSEIRGTSLESTRHSAAMLGDAGTTSLAPSWLQFAPWIALLYVTGVSVMFVRLGLSIVRSNRLCRSTWPIDNGPLAEVLQTLSQQWSLKVVPTLVEARNVVVPQVVGLLRPTILLPAAAVSGLSTRDLELVLAHELAHIRRHDMWVHLLQCVAETFLFFNPLLWYLSRRISTLREYCCDDITCRTADDPEPQLRYATALLRIMELRAPKPLDLTALAASGLSPSELRRRVARLFGEPLREPLRVSRTGLASSAIIIAVLAFSPTLWSLEQESDADEAASSAGKSSQATETDPASQDAVESEKLFQLFVIGPDERPVADASVELRATPPVTEEQVRLGSFEKKGAYGSFNRTDADGRLTVALPPAQSRLRVSIVKAGFGPYWTGWDAGTHPEEIPNRFTAKLDAGWSVGGIVVDEDDAPVKSAVVHLNINFKKRPGDKRQLGIGKRLRTDEQGKWRFDSVPSSQQAASVSINHPDFQALRRRLPREAFGLTSDESPHEPIKLNSGLTLTGTVTDAAGEPIEGALVKTKFINEIRQGTSDEQGRYRLTGCESRMARVVVSAEGYATDMREVQVDTDTKPVNFQMMPGGHVRVRVLDENGKGINRARIFFQEWRGPFQYFEFGHIGQYTNEDGVWEWNEAPLDEFRADISRPDGMQLHSQALLAREQEYVFKPPTMLVVSGSVVDATTKEPVLKFRVVPGTRNEPRRGTDDWWSRDEGYEATNGTYSVARRDAAPTHMIRIEAEGYKVTTSREIRSDEGKVAINFELQPAENIEVQLLNESGKPAAGARIAIGVAGSQIRVDAGEISDSQTYAARLLADEQGKFVTPPRDDPFQLVITHPDGFAHLKSTDGSIPKNIKLTTWARVEGTFRIGKEAVPNITLSLSSTGITSYGDGQPRIFTQNRVKTGIDGRFVFERAFPGMGFIGRHIVFMVDDGATEVASSKRVPTELVSGTTTTVNVGGDGRAVIGKLVPPEKRTDKVLWRFARIRVQADIPQPKWPEPPQDVQDNEARRQEWWLRWQQTEEGKAVLAASMKAQEEQRKHPSFYVSVDRDGAFRIDDVSEGKYVLSMRFDRGVPGHLSDYRFSVPPIDVDDVGKPLDIGTLKLNDIE